MIPSETKRGDKRIIRLKRRSVCYAENGMRSVPLKRTMQNVERFLLHSPFEIQFTHQITNKTGKIGKAVLVYHSPHGKSKDKYYFGKGLSTSQNIASACFEFFERYCAELRPEDSILESTYRDLQDQAVDPEHFVLAADSLYRQDKKIDWVWGYSLTRKVPLLVPANLVFCPYVTSDRKKIIAMPDSNGLASGNNLEEAILHGLLEVVERDQVMISEYNRMPFKKIRQENIPASCLPVIEFLNGKGFQISFLSGSSDIPVPFVAAFIHHKNKPANCSVAFGSYVDPGLAMERALTEAVQMIPPSVNHKKWVDSGAPQFFLSCLRDETPFNDPKYQPYPDIRQNIGILVSLLKDLGSEVIAVDLSLPEVPFPSVRILCTHLQPCIRNISGRLSQRFFNVPVKLGYKNEPIPLSELKIWNICGYK